MDLATGRFDFLPRPMFQSPVNVKLESISKARQEETATFQGRINRKLSLLFGLIIAGVLAVGAMSIYFARSIYVAAEEIRREDRETDIADRIHTDIHHFIFALQRARILSRPVPEDLLSAYRQQLEELLKREHGYHRETREQWIVDQIRATTSHLFRLAEKLRTDGRKLGPGLTLQDVDELSDVEANIQMLAHSLSVAHKVRMDRLLEQNKKSMQWIFSFYVGFFLLGTLLVLGSSFYLARTVAQPLRRLTNAARKITELPLPEKLSVESNDEIGLLSHTFNVMAAQLQKNERQLKSLAVLEERERIARELHDSLAQALALLNLKAAEAKSALSAGRTEATERTLSEMQQIVDEGYDDIRQAIFGLRTMVSKGAGFIPSLRVYLHDYSKLRQIPVELQVANPEVRFSPQVEVQVIRIIHEALTNVFKHAEARKSIVKFEQEGDYAKVIIEDDGKGCYSDGAENGSFHFGLKMMKERAEAAGGTFVIESAPNKGTKVIVCLPLERKVQDETDSSFPG